MGLFYIDFNYFPKNRVFLKNTYKTDLFCLNQWGDRGYSIEPAKIRGGEIS